MALSKTMEDAIQENDLGKIYSSFYTILLSDPGFANGKFDQALDELKSRNIAGLFQPYDGKAFKNRDEWSQQYWDCVASELMDNFCMERIEHLKEISKVLYPPVKKDISSGDVNKNRSDDQKKTEPIQSPAYNPAADTARLIAIGVILVIALIIIIVLVL